MGSGRAQPLWFLAIMRERQLAFQPDGLRLAAKNTGVSGIGLAPCRYVSPPSEPQLEIGDRFRSVTAAGGFENRGVDVVGNEPDRTVG